MDVEAIATGLDQWCQKRIARIHGHCQQHIMDGKSTDDPQYRTMLGQHQAYMAMRSYIHGSLRHHLIEKGLQPRNDSL